MSDLAWNIWGTVAGVFETILAMIPFITMWVYTRLPTAKLPGLLAIMGEAEQLFATAVRDDLFADERDLNRLKLIMLTTTVRVEEVSAIVYATESCTQNVRNWWSGLTGRILSLQEEVTALRAKLSKRNSVERKRRVAEGIPIDLTLLETKENKSPVPPHPPPYRGAPLHEDCEKASFAQGRVASAGPPTHHLISDADLHDLLSLALASSSFSGSRSAHRRATRKEVLRRLCKQLYGPDHPCFCGHDALRSKRSRFEALARLVRRIYGVRSLGGRDTDEAHLDPESLMPLHAEHNSCENDEEWNDE